MPKSDRKLYKTVEDVLARDIRTRNNDNWLLCRVLQELGYDIFIPYDKIPDMPSPETITRIRRKIQNDEGRFVAKEGVRVARRHRQEELRKKMPRPVDEWSD